MHLAAQHFVFLHQALSLWINILIIGLQDQVLPYRGHFMQGHGNRKPQAVLIKGARGDIPKLGDNLWREADALARGQQRGAALDSDVIGRVVTLPPPQQDVGVDKRAEPRVS